MARTLLRASIALFTYALIPSASLAHESWLLTPAEMDELARADVPDVFATPSLLLVFAFILTAIVWRALTVEDNLKNEETWVFGWLAPNLSVIGPLIIRLGLGIPMLLSFLGGLPRHGTDAWKQATLFVPDMPLSMAPGAEWLVLPGIALAVMLIAGVFTRIAASLTLAIVAIGCALFGGAFAFYYALHFAAPALLLIAWGGGPVSVDRYLPRLGPEPLDPWSPKALAVWRAALLMTGACFVLLAIGFKFRYPTMLIAILDHGNVPLFGFPAGFAALVMAGIECAAGTLLAIGRLVRPIACFLIGAFTFFAFVLGESPLMHANLYALMIVFLIGGDGVRRTVLRFQPDIRLSKTTGASHA